MSIHSDILRICDYCGICFDSRKILREDRDFGGLNPDQLASLRTFQENIVHFFDYYDKFMSITQTQSRYFLLFDKFINDFEARAVQVFHQMAQNFAIQFSTSKTLPTSRRGGLIRHMNDFMKDLCAGDMKKILKLVPSRELARDLGISDLQLRREIYLARQRVLNKRPVLKHKNKKKKEQEKESETFDQQCKIFDNADIPTCASPVSSIRMSSNMETYHDEDSIGNNELQFVDDSLTEWIHSDMIDH